MEQFQQAAELSPIDRTKRMVERTLRAIQAGHYYPPPADRLLWLSVSPTMPQVVWVIRQFAQSRIGPFSPQSRRTWAFFSCEASSWHS